jgi:hypothetical protein
MRIHSGVRQTRSARTGPPLHVVEIVGCRQRGDSGAMISTDRYSMAYRGELIGESQTPLGDGARPYGPNASRPVPGRGVIGLIAGVKWAAEPGTPIGP